MTSEDLPRLFVEGKFDVFEKVRKINPGELIERHKIPLVLGLVGLFFLGLGVFWYRDSLFSTSDKIEVLEEATQPQRGSSEVVVEISGAVEKPGVYKLREGSRVEDLLIAAGGLSVNADRKWVEKMLNRAAKLTDGQKIYIPRVGEQTLGESAKNSGGIKVYQEGSSAIDQYLVNLNTASRKELEDLPGIGPVYAQNIIEHRPYSSVEELVSRGVLKKGVFEKIKDKVTVY